MRFIDKKRHYVTSVSLKMKRSVKSVFKFLLLSISTVIFTVIIYKSIRNVFPVRHNFNDFQSNKVILPVVSWLNLCLLNVYITFALLQDISILNEKIDWHDYELITKDAKRTGNFLTDLLLLFIYNHLYKLFICYLDYQIFLYPGRKFLFI